MVDWSIDSSLNNAKKIIIVAVCGVAILAVINLIFQVLGPPTTLEELFQDTLLNWYFILAGLIAGAYAIRSNMNFLIKHIPWKKGIEERISNVERGIKPDTYYSETYAQKMKKPNPVVNNPKSTFSIPWGLLIVGIIIAISGYWIYEYSAENDRDAFQTWDGIRLFKSKSFTDPRVDLNFLLQDSSSSIHIYYLLEKITNNTFFGISLPYEGSLTERNNGWSTKPISNNSTLIYKIFLCKENISACNYNALNENEGNDQFNLLFKINDLIDAKQFYTHSLNIPVGGSANLDAMSFFQFNVTGGESYSWNSDAGDVDFQISVSVQDDATEINLIPLAHPRAFSFEPTQVNRTIYSWNVPIQDTSFHIDYVVPDERKNYETLNTFGIVFMGSGISIIAVFFGEIGKRKLQSK